MRTIRRIIVHCAQTVEGAWFDMKDVRAWHTLPPPRGNGWRGVGYHKLVLLDGTVQRGRQDSVIGAHVAGHNRDSLGICYVGGLAKGSTRSRPIFKDTRTKLQVAAMDEEIERWLEMYGRHVVVTGHNVLDRAKACPCYDVKRDALIRGLDWRTL